MSHITIPNIKSLNSESHNFLSHVLPFVRERVVMKYVCRELPIERLVCGLSVTMKERLCYYGDSGRRGWGRS